MSTMANETTRKAQEAQAEEQRQDLLDRIEELEQQLAGARAEASDGGNLCGCIKTKKKVPGGGAVKRYPWEQAPWWWGPVRSSTLPGFPILPPALAARLLRRAGRCVDDGCTGNAEKCAACCGRGGGR